MKETIKQVKDWHELFSDNPGVVALAFLAVGFLLREMIELSNIALAWLREFLRIERRAKDDSKIDK